MMILLVHQHYIQILNLVIQIKKYHQQIMHLVWQD